MLTISNYSYKHQTNYSEEHLKVQWLVNLTISWCLCLHITPSICILSRIHESSSQRQILHKASCMTFFVLEKVWYPGFVLSLRTWESSCLSAQTWDYIPRQGSFRMGRMHLDENFLSCFKWLLVSPARYLRKCTLAHWEYHRNHPCSEQ